VAFHVGSTSSEPSILECPRPQLFKFNPAQIGLNDCGTHWLCALPSWTPSTLPLNDKPLELISQSTSLPFILF